MENGKENTGDWNHVVRIMRDFCRRDDLHLIAREVDAQGLAKEATRFLVFDRRSKKRITWTVIIYVLISILSAVVMVMGYMKGHFATSADFMTKFAIMMVAMYGFFLVAFIFLKSLADPMRISATSTLQKIESLTILEWYGGRPLGAGGDWAELTDRLRQNLYIWECVIREPCGLTDGTSKPRKIMESSSVRLRQAMVTFGMIGDNSPDVWLDVSEIRS